MRRIRRFGGLLGLSDFSPVLGLVGAPLEELGLEEALDLLVDRLLLLIALLGEIFEPASTFKQLEI